MRKKGWVLLLVLLSVAFLMSCGKGTEPDEAKGELVRIERGMPKGILLFLYLCTYWKDKCLYKKYTKQCEVTT